MASSFALSEAAPAAYATMSESINEAMAAYQQSKSEPLSTKRVMRLLPRLSLEDAVGLYEFAISKGKATEAAFGDGTVIYQEWEQSKRRD